MYETCLQGRPGNYSKLTFIQDLHFISHLGTPKSWPSIKATTVISRLGGGCFIRFCYIVTYIW